MSIEIFNWSDLDLPSDGRLQRPKLLTPLGWILGIIAVAIGVVLGFAS
jgi:hypothetical protein